LNSEYELLHLIIHRNRNQHRMQKWWKYVSILHRKIRLLLHSDSQFLINLPLAEVPDPVFDEVECCRYLVYKVIPKAYGAFQRLLASGKFVALSLVLVAITCRIFSILSKDSRVVTKKEIKVKNDDVLDDLGKVVARSS
ncbi:uncharacterized protein V1516DRAFT_612239, partial [Lipomyces oligophaga]|uniref:uncharacterized protein n=1 Tax=Lipomyces oligophaga TaxID=45792 RepID=UPI0034CD1B9A